MTSCLMSGLRMRLSSSLSVIRLSSHLWVLLSAMRSMPRSLPHATGSMSMGWSCVKSCVRSVGGSCIMPPSSVSFWTNMLMKTLRRSCRFTWRQRDGEGSSPSKAVRSSRRWMRLTASMGRKNAWSSAHQISSPWSATMLFVALSSSMRKSLWCEVSASSSLVITTITPSAPTDLTSLPTGRSSRCSVSAATTTSMACTSPMLPFISLIEMIHLTCAS